MIKISETKLNITGNKFLINGQLTYSDIEDSKEEIQGLLMNARFIQGIFDDENKPQRFARFGMNPYDPEQNTDNLIAALPEWYDYGLRAFTVGLQGGGPVNTIEDWTTIDNNPYGEEGTSFDSAYQQRLDKLIKAADELGMIVIVSLLYQAQSPRLKNGKAIRNAVKTGCSVLKNGNYSNVIIEVANEHNVGNFSRHPIVYSTEGAAYLIELARKESGGLPVGCSSGGGEAYKEVCEASDVILNHGNGCTRQEFYNQIKKIRSWDLNKPIVCNEDSPCIGQLEVAFGNQVSWGYYNNLTKQEPPADWGITPGEDYFFARRMAAGIGIQKPPLSEEEKYYLQGFKPDTALGDKRWIRLASLYPEKINYVEFYKNGSFFDISYEEPYMVNYKTTWIQEPVKVNQGDRWLAKIYLNDGREIKELEKAVLR